MQKQEKKLQLFGEYLAIAPIPYFHLCVFKGSIYKEWLFDPLFVRLKHHLPFLETVTKTFRRCDPAFNDRNAERFGKCT